MSNLRNKVQLIGNLGTNPEVNTSENGKTWARFSMATTDHYKNGKGEKVEDTQWHNIVAFGKKAEIAEKFLQKGSQVGIEGKLNSRSYEDKEGIKKYYTEVLVNEILLLGGKN